MDIISAHIIIKRAITIPKLYYYINTRDFVIRFISKHNILNYCTVLRRGDWHKDYQEWSNLKYCETHLKLSQIFNLYVSRYQDVQLRVAENYWNVINLSIIRLIVLEVVLDYMYVPPKLIWKCFIIYNHSLTFKIKIRVSVNYYPYQYISILWS